jgi:hypothetical protein
MDVVNGDLRINSTYTLDSNKTVMGLSTVMSAVFLIDK